MVFWYILLQNTCVWLQWLGFRGKHSILCIRGFNYQALIRNLLVFQQSPTKSYQIDVFYKHYVHIFGKFHHFLYKSGFRATLLRVFGKILLISSQKSYILLLCSNTSLHKIKILCLLHVCFGKLCLVWHFHSKMSNSMLHVMASIYVQLYMCFASKNPHLVCVVYLWKQYFTVLPSTTNFYMYHVFCWCPNLMPTYK